MTIDFNFNWDSNPSSINIVDKSTYIVTLNSAARYAGDTTEYVPLPASAYIDYGTQDPKTATIVTLNIIDSSGNLFTTDMRKSNGINTNY